MTCDGLYRAVIVRRYFSATFPVGAGSMQRFVMNKEHQKIIDELIGEAALTLLQRSGPVNTQGLIDELHKMHAQASDGNQQTLINAAIAEVRNSVSAGRKRRDDQLERDNVHQLFSSTETPGSSRKH